MAHRAERLPITRRRILVASVASAGLAGVALALSLAHKPAASTAGEQTFTVQRRPFTATVNVVGSITPGDSADVVVPFDGVVRRVGFEYGRAVTPGQVLVAMDPFELEQRRRDAETAYLKAVQTDADMATWDSGSEVSHARRAVTSAELELKATQRKAAETKGLLDRGLVARSEYDGYAQQQQTQELALAAAHEDLAAAMKKGHGPARQVASIDLQNARARFADISGQLSGAVVRAAVAGIIVRPPVEKSDQGGGALHVGARLTRGQLIGSIAKAGGLAASFKLDEADADRVREGQSIEVTGPGFGDTSVAGHIVSVAGEANPPELGGTGSSFAATARLEGLTPEQARQIRIGMTANVTITTYAVPSAIVIPPQAVQGGAPSGVVMVRDPRTRLSHAAAISIGAVAPDGVEVRSGLSPGQIVVWRDVASAAASQH